MILCLITDLRLTTIEKGQFEIAAYGIFEPEQLGYALKTEA
jgi:hypothetical protein